MKYAVLSVSAILAAVTASPANATVYTVESGDQTYAITPGATAFSASFAKLNSATDILTSAVLIYNLGTIGTSTQHVIRSNPTPNALAQAEDDFYIDFNLISPSCNVNSHSLCNIVSYQPSVDQGRKLYNLVVTTYNFTNDGVLGLSAAQLTGNPGSTLNFVLNLSSYGDTELLEAETGIAISNTYVFDSSSSLELKYNYLQAVPDTMPASVPEPAMWAMMIAGLGLIGSTLRRARKPAAQLCGSHRDASR